MMADEEQRALDQAILASLQSSSRLPSSGNRPSGGTAVSVHRDGARTETERYDYKAQMMNRHESSNNNDDREQQQQFRISGSIDENLEDERRAASSRQQQPREAAVSPGTSNNNNMTLVNGNEELTDEKARQKKEQAARNKKLCLIGSAVVFILVAVIVIVVVLVAGGDDGSNSSNATANTDPAAETTVTPAPVPAPLSGTPAPSVAWENLDIKDFATISFWFVQYGFNFMGCERNTPPALTVFTYSKAYFVELQEQSEEHGMGKVTCDRIARNKVSCYPQDPNVTSIFSTVLIFAAAAPIDSVYANTLHVRLEPTTLQNCSVDARAPAALALGHVCFPNGWAESLDDMRYQSSREGTCSGLSVLRGFTNTDNNNNNDTIGNATSEDDSSPGSSSLKVIRFCFRDGGCDLGSCENRSTLAIAATEVSSERLNCRLKPVAFDWNSQAMWQLIDESLYLPNFATYIST